jgi:hypothetical protein
LDLSKEGVIRTTKKDKNTSLYDFDDKHYIGLKGDLDLSDFTNLKELNLSYNYHLEKVDIRQCSALERLFIISNPHDANNHNEQMKMSNLVIADNYPSLQVLVCFGSHSDNVKENKLVKYNSSNFRLLVKSLRDDRL